jgi:transposase
MAAMAVRGNHLFAPAPKGAKLRLATLLLDQPGWRMSGRLVVPDNITLLPPPPKCPELIPAENFWHYMRDNMLSNWVFTSYEEIVDHCCNP